MWHNLAPAPRGGSREGSPTEARRAHPAAGPGSGRPRHRRRRLDGCVLANRLSADPGTSVLVLEAGRADLIIDLLIHAGGLPFSIGNPLYDWKYESEPEPFANNRRIYHARGKVLGGPARSTG